MRGIELLMFEFKMGRELWKKYMGVHSLELKERGLAGLAGWLTDMMT